MKIDIIRSNNDPFARYKMPKLEITTEGKSTNTRTVLLNLPDIGKSLKRSPLMLIKYICNDKGTNYDLKNQKYIIKGNYKQNELQDMIYNFIDENVLCAECNNPETFYIPGKTILMKCYACGSGRQIARNKMYNVIEKEIGDTQLENKHYEESQVEIMDADDFDSFMSKNQLSKEQAMQMLVTKFDIEKLIILRDKIESNDAEILVNSVKEHCAEKQQHEKVKEYIEFIVSNKICIKGDCYKFFMAKSKKLNKDDNAKIKKVAKEYFNN